MRLEEALRFPFRQVHDVPVTWIMGIARRFLESMTGRKYGSVERPEDGRFAADAGVKHPDVAANLSADRCGARSTKDGYSAVACRPECQALKTSQLWIEMPGMDDSNKFHKQGSRMGISERQSGILSPSR